MKIYCEDVNQLDPPPEVVAFVNSFGGRNLFNEPLFRLVWINRRYAATQDRMLKARIQPDHFALEAWQPDSEGLSRGHYKYVDDFAADDGESFCWPSIGYTKALITKYRMLMSLNRAAFNSQKENEVEKNEKQDVENLYDQIHDHIPRSVGAPTVYQPGRAAH